MCEGACVCVFICAKENSIDLVKVLHMDSCVCVCVCSMYLECSGWYIRGFTVGVSMSQVLGNFELDPINRVESLKSL